MTGQAFDLAKRFSATCFHFSIALIRFIREIRVDASALPKEARTK